MIGYVAEKIGRKLVKGQIVVEEDQELYVFGIQQGIHMVLGVMMVLILGIVLQQFWQSIIFMIFFVPLRQSAGGYHADTRVLCYILSFFIFLVVLLFIKYGFVNNTISVVAIILTGACVMILAPVQTENNPLSSVEVSLHKKRSRVIWLCEIILLIGICLLKLQQVQKSVLAALVLVSIILILGKLKINFR